MAESTDTPTPADTGYVLNFPTDGTSFGVRENLVDILERELLGPIHGDGPKVACKTCHKGYQRPMQGMDVIGDWPELAAPGAPVYE